MCIVVFLILCRAFRRKQLKFLECSVITIVIGEYAGNFLSESRDSRAIKCPSKT